MNTNYSIKLATPSVETYCRLRSGSGLSPRTEEAAQIGLKGTLFAVQVLCHDEPVGMGRVIGDGGCCFQVVDIAVLPEHQGKGLGKQIMREVMTYLDANVPKSAYVCLFADGKAKDLYAQYGFRASAPKSIGMVIEA